MKKLFTTLLLAGFTLLVNTQNLPNYQIFNKKGKAVTFNQMVKELEKNQIILFGEYHDDPLIHWFQLRFTQEVHKSKGANLMLGAEMFERDVQYFLTNYLNGIIDEKTFKDSAHSLWPNYKTDYRPLVEFAKENKLNFVAANVPRYIARMVYLGGFESLETLSDLEKTYIPKLPIPYDSELPGYKAMLEMAMGHGGDKLPKAQALKDATMASSIIENLKPDNTFIHYNGSYHSDNYDGIVWYLNYYTPGLKIGTISTVRQEQVKKLDKEHIGRADFIICVIEDMTRTH
ncbi:MAG: ChaN family lipoprotein [Flavobacteriales bacterium]